MNISVERLIKALNDADSFKFPEMTKGQKYLHTKLFEQLSRGEYVKLSDIDFDSFELDDVDSLRDLYIDVFDFNEVLADRIVGILHDLPPITVNVSFA